MGKLLSTHESLGLKRENRHQPKPRTASVSQLKLFAYLHGKIFENGEVKRKETV
jgi:hypothetical protein